MQSSSFLAPLAGAALLVTGVATGAAAQDQAAIYAPAEGISQRFGSKHAAGYFLKTASGCAVTMFLAENANDPAAPMPVRLQIDVKPGETAALGSPEGQAIAVKCGPDASTLEVRRGEAARILVRNSG